MKLAEYNEGAEVLERRLVETFPDIVWSVDRLSIEQLAEWDITELIAVMRVYGHLPMLVGMKQLHFAVPTDAANMHFEYNGVLESVGRALARALRADRTMATAQPA